MGSGVRREGSGSIAPGSGITSHGIGIRWVILLIYVFFFCGIGDQAVALLWDQGSKSMGLG